MEVVIGWMAAAVSWRCEASRIAFFLLFFGFWLGLISIYSCELGFGSIVAL